MATGYSRVWSNGWASLRIYYTTSYDPAANRSTVTVTPQLKSQYNYGTDYRLYDAIYNNTAGVYGNGVKLFSLGEISGSSYLSCGSCHNAWASFNRSFSFTVGHDAAGEASFTVGVLGSVRHYYNGGATVSPIGAAASASITLRENAPSVIASSTSAAATQSLFSLTMRRSLPTNTHIAVFRYGSDTLYTSEPFDSTLSFTVPRAWFADYPALSSLNVSVSVQTYSGGTALGSPAAAALTVSADEDMRPKLCEGWAALSAYNTGAAAGLTGYIRGFSRAEAVFDPTKIDLSDTAGASVASYAVSCQGAGSNASPYRTGVLSATSVNVVCSVTDTRGRTASESFPLSVMDYAAPLIASPELFRCDSLGTADGDGAYISVKALGSCSPLNGQNSCTLSAAVKAAGGSYGADVPLSGGAAALFGPGSPDLNYSVRITAVDALGTTSVRYISIPTRKWAMKFRANGSGVAFGKVPEADGVFEIADDWAVKSKGIVDLVYPVGSIYMSVGSTSPQTLFGGTWERIEDRFLLASGTTYTAGGTGGEAAHTLTVSEMPSHKHGFKRISASLQGGSSYARMATSGSADNNLIEAAGGNKPHNNMPPYLAVYIWKRTA